MAASKQPRDAPGLAHPTVVPANALVDESPGDEDASEEQRD